MFRNASDLRILSAITFVTTFGDFLTYFSVVTLIYQIHQSAIAAAFGGVGIGSAAAVVAGLLVPVLFRFRSTRSLVLISQVLSAVMVVMLLVLLRYSRDVAWPFLLILFLQTFFSKLYESARESHSHGLSDENTDHRSVQALILGGLYRAQFLGPITAFFFIKVFPIEVPVYFDLATFILAIALAMRLKSVIRFEGKVSAFSSFIYLQSNLALRRLFVLRTFGFWIPASLFNIVIYENVVARFGVGVEYSGVVYALLGFGALLGALLSTQIVSIKGFAISENIMAGFSQLGFATTVGLMFFAEKILWGSFCYFLYGVFMGLNAVSTQAMRRSLCDKSQMPELIGMETIVSFGVQFLLSVVVSFYWKSLTGPLQLALLAIAIFYVITAVSFFNFPVRQRSAN
jgi:hypothetical protein